MNTPQTIHQCRRGNRRAQRRLYEHYLPYVLTVVRRFGVEEREQADVVQEVFAAVFAQLDAYDPAKGKFTTWLRTLCVRRTVDFLRRRKLVFTELKIDLPTESYERFDLRAYSAEQLIAVIQTLPVGYRTVFNLFAVDGYSHQEIADLLGIKAATSRSQYARARQLIREKLCPQAKSPSHAN